MPYGVLIEALLRPGAYDHPVDTIQLVETHISWVLLTGPYAYKIKKPVRFSFLDFSTLERRKKFCDEELRLNRRLAPSLYLAVVPIGGTEQSPILGRAPAIEYAVKMRQFPHAARLDQMLARDAVNAADFREFARRVAEFHAGLEPPPPDTRLGSPAIVIRNALNNLRDLEDAVNDAELDILVGLGEWTESQCVRLEEAFKRRKKAGAIRECHGDLHLQNLVAIDGQIVAFDALEFEPELRWMDVMSETAFLTMDLTAHGRADLAHEFLNSYLECSGDYVGLEVLPFYLVYRALVRAKVDTLRARQASAGAADQIPYVRQAARLIARDRSPLLLITHGLSGSGKSTVAELLVGSMPAVRIRSDLERKRLHGFAAHADTESRVAEGIYSANASQQTYATLAHYAQLGLEAGLNIVVDAAFLSRSERRAFADLAARCGARFLVLDCQCPEAVLRARIAQRRAVRTDPSEATADVLDYQLTHAEPLDAEQRDAVSLDTAHTERVGCAALDRRTRGLTTSAIKARISAKLASRYGKRVRVAHRIPNDRR
jgi:aminoglycoside phosphotransferase family enzyme/predicted kinase